MAERAVVEKVRFGDIIVFKKDAGFSLISADVPVCSLLVVSTGGLRSPFVLY